MGALRGCPPQERVAEATSGEAEECSEGKAFPLLKGKVRHSLSFAQFCGES